MDLRQLRYFVAVGEELNYRNAALRLNISQPPLNRQIKDLELEVGVQLLRRDRRSVQLTGAGKVFLDRARHLLKEASEIKQAASQASNKERPELTVGFSRFTAYSILPAALKIFREENPGIALNLKEINSPNQVSELDSGNIDIVFSRPEGFSRSIEVEVLLREPFLVAFQRSHPLASLAHLSLADLAYENFVTFARQRMPEREDSIFNICAASGFVPKIVHEVLTIHAALSLVAAGIGIAILPASVLQLNARNVIYRIPEGYTPLVDVVVAWRRSYRSRAVEQLVVAARLATLSYQKALRRRLMRVSGGNQIAWGI